MPKDSPRARPTRQPKRRQRRSSEEIIDRLIEAACDEFEHNGYAGAKTAAIARRAGVAEALIFSNFGSKAQLFQDAIFKPLNRQFLDFHSAHNVDTSDRKALEQGARRYIAEVQEFVERHSRMLMSLFVAQLYAPDNLDGVNPIQGLHDYFSRTTAMAEDRLTGTPRIHPKLVSRLSFATILACVIFRDLLFPKGLASQREIRDAISDFLMDGLSANAAAPLEPARPDLKRRRSGTAARRVRRA